MNSKVNPKTVSVIFYLLVLPQIFLMISSIAFYIHAGLISGYSSISGISPERPLFYEVYPAFINSCLLLSYFTFFVWAVLAILYWFIAKNITIKTSIVFGAIVQVLVIYFIFSPLFSFAVD